MFYRIKFRACPSEYIFEVGNVNYDVLVRDAIQLIRLNFKIKRDNLNLYDDTGSMLKLLDKIENGKTYIVRRVPR